MSDVNRDDARLVRLVSLSSGTEVWNAAADLLASGIPSDVAVRMFRENAKACANRIVEESIDFGSMRIAK